MKHSKIFKFLFLIVFTAICITSCTTDDDTTPVTRRRTIMVYFNAEELSDAAEKDLQELVDGAKNLPEDCNLVAYFDNASTTPCIYHITKNGKEIIKKYSSDHDSSSPTVILNVLQTMVTSYPASEYITVFWGHGTGANIMNAKSTVSRAYGADNTFGESWIDIPDMADVLKDLGIKHNILMFDACLLQSVEIVYELKDYADYIIGCCCETPAFGAPYKYMVPVMAEENIEQTAIDMTNTYIDKNEWRTDDDCSDGVCISAVKTSAMESLFKYTKEALDTIQIYSTSCPLNLTAKYTDYPYVSSCIFYWFAKSNTTTNHLYYDMNDVMLHNLSTYDYSKWKSYLDKAIIAKRHPLDITELKGIYSPNGKQICDWIPATLNNDFYFRLFLLNDDTYGGLSMYVPCSAYEKSTSPASNMNQTMHQYKWYDNIGWTEKGW